jgi:hypothetical protein
MFNLFKKTEIVYCQRCGKEIVSGDDNLGAYVSKDGRVFCLREDMSSFYGDLTKGSFKMDYRTYSELQEDIKEKRLIHFGKLEDVLRG